MSLGLSKLLGDDFMPHGHCFLWTPDVLWTNVISDAFIALAYFSIPVALFVFERRRTDLIFHWMFLLFAGFILACGMTHVFDVWNVWHGHYRLAGLIKAITALLSITTAFMLWPLIPKALAIPSPKDLQTANESLQKEINERISAENQLRALNVELENRVESRTALLKQSNKDLEKFAYMASHDLQQPLRTISVMLEMIERQNHDKFDEENRKLFVMVREASQKMSELIKSILNFSRVGSRIVTYSMIESGQIFDIACRNVRHLIEEANAQINVAKLPTIFFDGSHLLQIFQNLLINALKYRSPSPCIIGVTASEDAESWTFKLQDNGIGIAPKNHEVIFDMFKRLHSDQEFPGSGMGLAICRRIIENFSGKIWVESEEGKGSTFCFMIPKISASALDPITTDPSVHS